MPTANRESEELFRDVKACLANTELMRALGRIISQDDKTALAVLRSRPMGKEAAEAAEILRHNERFRHWFRAASPEKDPFDG